jgi:uncharacterized protein (TIRG00374 family)
LSDKTIHRSFAFNRRSLVYLVFLAIGVFVFVPHIIGFNHVIELLAVANPIYLGLALFVEILRYFFSAGSTIILARTFQRRVPLIPMTEAFFAGNAMNRIFSTGGAPGMLVRILFLGKEQIHAGTVAVIFLIEDVIGLVIGGAVLFVGILIVSNTLPRHIIAIDLAIASIIATPLLILAAWFLYRHRAWVERGIHAIARILNSPVVWLFNSNVFAPQIVQEGLNDFYAGIAIARRHPANIFGSLVMNMLRYVAGGAALYFSFSAMGFSIAPGTLILIYTSASVLSTMSAIPGEVAIMGASFAILSFSVGIPQDITLTALVLSRSTSFWMPIPVGLITFWHLRRKHLL